MFLQPGDLKPDVIKTSDIKLETGPVQRKRQANGRYAAFNR